MGRSEGPVARSLAGIGPPGIRPHPRPGTRRTAAGSAFLARGLCPSPPRGDDRRGPSAVDPPAATEVGRDRAALARSRRFGGARLPNGREGPGQALGEYGRRIFRAGRQGAAGSVLVSAPPSLGRDTQRAIPRTRGLGPTLLPTRPFRQRPGILRRLVPGTPGRRDTPPAGHASLLHRTHPVRDGPRKGGSGALRVLPENRQAGTARNAPSLARSFLGLPCLPGGKGQSPRKGPTPPGRSLSHRRRKFLPAGRYH